LTTRKESRIPSISRRLREGSCDFQYDRPLLVGFHALEVPRKLEELAFSITVGTVLLLRFEEEVDADVEDLGELPEPRRRYACDASFVLVHLMERDLQPLCNGFLGEAEHDATQSDAATYASVDLITLVLLRKRGVQGR
jgi:hypothetical protein